VPRKQDEICCLLRVESESETVAAVFQELLENELESVLAMSQSQISKVLAELSNTDDM